MQKIIVDICKGLKPYGPEITYPCTKNEYYELKNVHLGFSFLDWASNREIVMNHTRGTLTIEFERGGLYVWVCFEFLHVDPRDMSPPRFRCLYRKQRSEQNTLFNYSSRTISGVPPCTTPMFMESEGSFIKQVGPIQAKIMTPLVCVNKPLDFCENDIYIFDTLREAVTLWEDLDEIEQSQVHICYWSGEALFMFAGSLTGSVYT